MKKIHVCLLLLFMLQGCTVYYYDPKTGAEYVWGIGHMAMKATVPQEGHRAVVRRTDVFGIATGISDEGGYLALGWDGVQRVNILDANTAVNLQWSNCDLLSLRVGSPAPTISHDAHDTTKEGKP